MKTTKNQETNTTGLKRIIEDKGVNLTHKIFNIKLL